VLERLVKQRGRALGVAVGDRQLGQPERHPARDAKEVLRFGQLSARLQQLAGALRLAGVSGDVAEIEPHARLTGRVVGLLKQRQRVAEKRPASLEVAGARG
jgi:hypothetical protein